ncbi:bacterial regulatory s, tetR family protein [Collimonas fungivorans]|uniref:Bacterial regulatory s, tetR family protein n=1 Tax=Collimonas fungivorans TaxID=158899 RepID=A0A127PG31_9BURK|nr:bacterial regulatory s, tetR family protein [Collimonas fungivorans]
MPDSVITDHINASRGRGRPREFDMEQALDKAVRVFSERGYHATTVCDLTQAMQLASGSVYKAFKDKKSVFLAALDRYKTVRDTQLRAVIGAGATGKEQVRLALAFYAEASHGAGGLEGCMVVGSAAELATFDSDVAQWVTAALTRNEVLLGTLIRQGRQDGSIPQHVDDAATARLLLCLIQGMRVVGKTGRTRDEMTVLVDIAMKVLA